MKEDAERDTWTKAYFGAPVRHIESKATASLKSVQAGEDDRLFGSVTARDIADALQAGRIAVVGSVQALQSLLATLDQFNRMFPVVGPRPPALRQAFPPALPR